MRPIFSRSVCTSPRRHSPIPALSCLTPWKINSQRTGTHFSGVSNSYTPLTPTSGGLLKRTGYYYPQLNNVRHLSWESRAQSTKYYPRWTCHNLESSICLLAWPQQQVLPQALGSLVGPNSPQGCVSLSSLASYTLTGSSP